MKVIPPKPITLLSTNVAPEELAVWTAGTYDLGAQVQDTRTTPHVMYESLIADNISDPAIGIGWKNNGVTNQWAMFDNIVSSQTENAESIVVEVDSGRCDSLALFMLDATEVTVELTKDSEVIFTETVDLNLDPSTSWSDYFNEEFNFRSDMFTMFPIYFETSLKVTITKTGGTAKCGHLVVGRGTYIGQSKWGVSPGIMDFSRKERNDFGQAYLNVGDYAKRMDIDVNIRTGSFDIVHANLIKLRATPLVWQGNNDGTNFQSILVFGFYREFSPVLSGPEMSQCSLEIEGLT